MARSAARLSTAAVLLVLHGVLLLLSPRRSRPRAARSLARAVLRALGVRHERRGPLPVAGSLLVAHHISWLDVLVLIAHAPTTLVAKREVRGWPLLGRLATAGGVVFLDRDRPRSLPHTVGEVRRALRARQNVAVFPEGTTWCGEEAGLFRPALFQAAIDARAPVVPVGLRFELHSGHRTTVAAFVGDDALVSSLLRVARQRGLIARLRFTEPMHPWPGESRRQLAAAASVACRGDAGVGRPEAWRSPTASKKSVGMAETVAYRGQS